MSVTPGPWTFEHGTYRMEGRVRASDGRCVAQMVRAEDGAIIATAPELLAALKTLAHMSRSYIEHMDEADLFALETVRATISKAEGK